jgi:catechol 2,3-dioxygenase-like lactoylglutathione lyase family enzyme
MKPRITVLTLAVRDLEASLHFYRDGLGFPSDGIVGTEYEHGAVAFFEMQPNLQLALWSRDDLAHDTGLSVADPDPPAFSIGHNVASRDEVDVVMAQAASAGARIVKAADDTFWGGYAGYFQDPDGHLWEVVWNPALAIHDQ